VLALCGNIAKLNAFLCEGLLYSIISEFPKEDGTTTGTSARPRTSRSGTRCVNQHFAFPIDDHDLELAPKSNTENGGFLIHAA